MLRKIFLSVCVFAVIVGFQSKISAQDAWVYTADGVEYYVMNETAVNNSRPGHVLIDVKVKNIKQGEQPELLGVHDYHFELTESFTHYSTDGKAESNLLKSNIVTRKICIYCLNYLGIDVGKVFSMKD